METGSDLYRRRFTIAVPVAAKEKNGMMSFTQFFITVYLGNKIQC